MFHQRHLTTAASVPEGGGEVGGLLWADETTISWGTDPAPRGKREGGFLDGASRVGEPRRASVAADGEWPSIRPIRPQRDKPTGRRTKRRKIGFSSVLLLTTWAERSSVCSCTGWHKLRAPLANTDFLMAILTF